MSVTKFFLVKWTFSIDYLKSYIGHPTQSPFNYRNLLDRHHNFCKLDNDFTSYCFTSKPGKGKEKCHRTCLNTSAPTTTTTPTTKPVQIHRTVKHETAGYSQGDQYRSKAFINQPQSKVLNCEQTAVCDITINNPLREAFRVVIHPMAEVRFIESIRNGTHVNIDSIQPSSIWLFPQSK